MAKNTPAAQKGTAPAAAPAAKPQKTDCPITREQFRSGAKTVEITINGVPMLAEVKEFSTGSLGWYLNGKTVVKVGDVPCSVQIGLNLTIVNSKELPQD